MLVIAGTFRIGKVLQGIGGYILLESYYRVLELKARSNRRLLKRGFARRGAMVRWSEL